jgi:hypothetical protein
MPSAEIYHAFDGEGVRHRVPTTNSHDLWSKAPRATECGEHRPDCI